MAKCPAELHIYDDFQDNHSTIHCDLDEGHEDTDEQGYEHQCEFRLRVVDNEAHSVTIKWQGSDRGK